jgi:hypothetical protein
MVALRFPWKLAGAAALTYAGVRLTKSLLRQGEADEGFFDWTGPSEADIDVGSASIDLPIRYYRDDAFMGVFPASFEAIEAALPSERLRPVRLFGNRAAVAIIAFNYIQTSVGPYGEVGIAPLCTLDREGPPLVAALLESAFDGFGAFVAHLPVTSLIARDAGRTIWGYPKFVADMEFERRPAYQSVRLSENGAEILTLHVRQGGMPIRDNRPLTTFSVRGSDLVQTVVPTRSTYQVGMSGDAGRLELGDHPIGDWLRTLGVESVPVQTKNYLSRAGILPAGTVVGGAAPHARYEGAQVSHGLHTVAYDDSTRIVVTEREGTPARAVV